MGCSTSSEGSKLQPAAAVAAEAKEISQLPLGEPVKEKLSPEQEKSRAEAKQKRLEAKKAKKQQLIHAADHGPPQKSHIVVGHPDVGIFASETGAEDVHVASVFETFKKYMTDNNLKQLDVDGFLSELKTLNMFKDKEDLARRLFSVMDTSNDGFLDLGELLTGLSVFNKGTRKEKLQICFQAYDQDNDGAVEKSELRQIILSQVRATLNATALALDSQDEFDDLAGGRSGQPKGLTRVKSEKFEVKALEDGTQVIKIITPLGTATVVQTPEDKNEDPFVALHGEDVLNELVDKAFEQFDKDHNGSINFEEFSLFIGMHPHLKDWFHDLEG